MSACCSHRSKPMTTSWVGRCRELGTWVFATAILALMPKCPACLAVYIAVWTGFGLSLSTATYLRMSLLILCAATLVYLVLTRLSQFVNACVVVSRWVRRLN
jgi:hypothetical protein